jgi:hypothetical protein
MAPDERALGLDRAEVLIERHGTELEAIWDPDPVHPEVATILNDARAALGAARKGLRPPD